MDTNSQWSEDKMDPESAVGMHSTPHEVSCPQPESVSPTPEAERILRRRLDGALDRAARRLCGAVMLILMLLGAYSAGNQHCLPDAAGHGCGSLRWVAVTIKKTLPPLGAVTGDALSNVGRARPAHSACNDALAVRRVALLFLSKGALPHEGLWEAWLRPAGGLLPLQSVQGESCNASLVAAACATEPSESALDRQLLFSVYNHPAPGFHFDEGSIFRGHEIADRVHVRSRTFTFGTLEAHAKFVFQRCIQKVTGLEIHTDWGSTSLTVALRLLLTSALAEPTNQWFVLLSESGVPLYPAAVVYQTLMGYNLSRVNACPESWLPPPLNQTAEMAWPVGNAGRPPFTFAHWRKSAQWVGLLRKHAQLIVDDIDIMQAFDSTCEGGNTCLLEEHYVPSFLSYMGRENETDCMGRLLSANWSQGGAHPKTYAVEEVTQELMLAMRNSTGCKPEDAISLGIEGFVDAQRVSSAGWCQGTTINDPLGSRAYQWQPELLGPQCALFVRKFPADTAAAVQKLDTEGKPAADLRIVTGLSREPSS